VLEVVGDVEQPAHERDVLLDHLGLCRSGVGAVRFKMKPPFDPSGTITAFFTICAFIRPRTSVR
jgi:hypothetical protein